MTIDPPCLPEESPVTRRQWDRAWDPLEVLVRYFLVSLILSFLVLVPLGRLVGIYSLGVLVAVPVLGLVLGFVVWRRACSAVNQSYRDILDMVVDDCQVRGEETQVWLSEMDSSDEQHRLEPAREYTFTRIVSAETETVIEELTVNLPRLTTTIHSERIPIEKITSKSFDDGTFTLCSTRGNWEMSDLECIS